MLGDSCKKFFDELEQAAAHLLSDVIRFKQISTEHGREVEALEKLCKSIVEENWWASEYHRLTHFAGQVASAYRATPSDDWEMAVDALQIICDAPPFTDAKLRVLGWYIFDAVAANAESPGSFELPSKDEIANVKPGDFIKIGLVSESDHDRLTEGVTVRFTDVRSREANKQIICGVVENQPEYSDLHGVEHNVDIELEARHILSTSECARRRSRPIVLPTCDEDDTDDDEIK